MSPYVRRHPRQTLTLPAVLVIGGRRRSATLVDLSRGGAGLRGIESDSEVSRSASVRIRIDVPLRGPLTVRGRLVRVHYEGGVRYGVSFDRIPPATLRRIESLTLPAPKPNGAPPGDRSLLSQTRRLSLELRELTSAAARHLRSARAAVSDSSAGARLMDNFAGRREALAAVVHELRRPITTVLGWASLLRERKLDQAKTTRALLSIEEAARALDRRTGDLFDLSRLMLGRLTLDRRTVDARALVEQTVRDAEPAARRKKIRLAVSLGRIPRPLFGDPDRLAQAVGNLLSNAVKFTPEGGRIALRLQNERGRACRLVVRDSGIGIPEEVLDRLFQPFTRGHPGYPGLGLGLSLARSVCELHGGSLVAASPGEGRGSVFTLRLPYGPPPA